MNIIIPITITDAMLGAGTTVAEPSAAETAWATGTAYAVGDVRIRATTHRKYRCAVAHTSAASPTPENDPTRWVDIGPTDRWAPFDTYTSTAATTTTTLTYVISPGFFNAIALYGLTGASYAITVRDGPGGATIYSQTGYLTENPVGWYEYLFAQPRTITKVLATGIPIRPTAQATITITAAAGQPVGLGMAVLGDYTPLIADATALGGVEYGAKAEPITYSYIKTNDDGTTSIIRRHAATNVRATVVLPQAYADSALAILQSVLDVPVAVVASNVPGYAGLNAFGLIQAAPVSYDGPGRASIDINVKGFV